MATTAFPCMKMTGTWPPSLPPWGHYRYKTAPLGNIASGDGYSMRFDELVSPIPNKTKCNDDTLLWADNLTKTFFQAVNWLDLCGHHIITLNPDKFVFRANTVEFTGFEITPDNISPSKKYLDAICNFPTPTNTTDTGSWFSQVNQVSYVFSTANQMLSFQELLKPGIPLHWDNTLESKDVIISKFEQGVHIFDKSKPTCLATNWSKHGIGFWLFQKRCKCNSDCYNM